MKCWPCAQRICGEPTLSLIPIDGDKKSCNISFYISGAILNFVGATSIIVSFTALPASQKANPPDYSQYRLFTAGAALTFGAIYFYLFQNPQYAVPFLLFGMFLRCWAFMVSFYAYVRCGLSSKDFFGFGVSNLIFAALFGIYLLSGDIRIDMASIRGRSSSFLFLSTSSLLL